MSETNRLQAHGLARMLFIFTCTIKGRWGFCGFWFSGVNTSQDILLVGMGKSKGGV
jgi:hypothetical protein